MTKLAQLQRTKKRAHLLLISALFLYLISLFLPQNIWVHALKAMMEAALVGGLADWFAVSALFHKIPIPLLQRHTGIITNNKVRIADSLGEFIQARFFHSQALTELVQRYDLINFLSSWLQITANTQKLAQAIQQILYKITSKPLRTFNLNFASPAETRWWQPLNLRLLLTNLLEGLMRDNRQQAFLDFALLQLTKLLQNPSSRHYLAQKISSWFSQEYPVLARLLSSQWLGKKGAGKLSDLVDSLPLDVAQDRNHQIRRKINQGITHLFYRLRHDPILQQQVDSFVADLIQDPAFQQGLKKMTNELYRAVHQALIPENSDTARAINKIITNLSIVLANDKTMREMLNQQLQAVLLRLAPKLVKFTTEHISSTIRQWDDTELNRQIELNIGHDLQYIRINGCLVGAVIGLLLFCLSQASHWLQNQWF